ncbi:lysis system i-spanin subunit Rz [Pseudomonas luteola]|uniref:Lysis protein n=1 Tax=Pseudomonas luteola TaxID=47886 RepID=A0ABS0MX49_PSELU|nr:lysis system i-spanin subunit Rz [Pseudomonas luteola]MBH3440554.1 lysis protein [Pseudomonas luteola]
MNLTALIQQYKAVFMIALVLGLMTGSGMIAWKWQEKSYQVQLAEKDRVYQSTLMDIAKSSAVQFKKEAERRAALESQLAQVDQQQYGKLTDVKKQNQSLRDRLATAELRLSVLIDNSASGSRAGMSTGSTSTGLDDGAHRAYLQPKVAADLARLADDADQCAIKLRGLQAREKSF